MQFGAVDHRIGMFETSEELLVDRELGHLLGGQSVHEEAPVDEHCRPPRAVAQAEPIENMEGVRPELYASADLGDYWRALQHDRGNAQLGQRQCSGEAADAAPADDDGFL